MSRSRLSSGAHHHCHTSRLGHGQYRFCIHCWRGRESEIPSDLSGLNNPGLQLPGCIKVHNSSPGSLLKHATTHGFCLKASSNESICDEPCDEGVTRDWVHAHILQDLQPFPPLTVLGHGDSTKKVHAMGSARGQEKGQTKCHGVRITVPGHHQGKGPKGVG